MSSKKIEKPMKNTDKFKNLGKLKDKNKGWEKEHFEKTNVWKKQVWAGHACNPNNPKDTEAEGSWVQDEPGQN